MKWATAIARKSLGIAANVLSPAFAGSKNLLCLDPGAYAPGFMLPPASQAKTELFVQSSAWIQSVPPAVAGGLGQSQTHSAWIKSVPPRGSGWVKGRKSEPVEKVSSL